MIGLFKELVDKGTWSGTFAPSVKTGIVAAGNASQANATALTATVNVVSTAVAATSDSVRLPKIAGIGETCLVANDDDGTINVYPASGQSINAAAADAVFTMATGKRALFVAISATKWAAFTS